MKTENQKTTITQLVACLRTREWHNEADLLATPHWDKEQVKETLENLYWAGMLQSGDIREAPQKWRWRDERQPRPNLERILHLADSVGKARLVLDCTMACSYPGVQANITRWQNEYDTRVARLKDALYLE